MRALLLQGAEKARAVSRPFLAEIRERVPYDISRGPEGEAWLRGPDRDYSPEELLAHIVRELKNVVERSLYRQGNPQLPLAELVLDLRSALHLDEAAARDCDLLLLHGWFDAGDWVRRELPVLPQVTAATPAYWQRHGVPRHPSELAGHVCLCYRNPYGKLLDLWRFRQVGPQDEVVEQVVGSEYAGGVPPWHRVPRRTTTAVTPPAISR